MDFLDFMRCPFWDRVMIFISSLADKGIIWIIAGLTMIFFKETRRLGVCVLLALLINLLIVNVCVKPLVARTRPFDVNTAVKLILDAPKDFSFPSGHTSASFASAVSIFLINKKWGSISLALAFLIGFSRMYLYVHFPSDVIMGAVFGTAAAFVSRRVVCRAFEYRCKRRD